MTEKRKVFIWVVFPPLMQVNFLKSVVEDIAGKQATEIVRLLEGKKDVNEFLIAKKLKQTINQTRNILYKLADRGLVSFTRKKDKRKGWYIYFWTLNVLKSLEILKEKLDAEIKQLNNQLKNRRTKRFYFCETCNAEVGEETALLNDFTCKECGQIYALAKQDKIIKDLENRIEKLKRRAGIIEEARADLAEKEEKKIIRKSKRDEKKKKDKRKSMRARKNVKKAVKEKVKEKENLKEKRKK